MCRKYEKVSQYFSLSGSGCGSQINAEGEGSLIFNKYTQLKTAFDVIGNEERRRRYDALRMGKPDPFFSIEQELESSAIDLSKQKRELRNQ